MCFTHVPLSSASSSWTDPFLDFELFLDLFAMPLCASVYMWSPAWKGLTSWLSFVVSYCEFGTFPSVSWVRCGT